METRELNKEERRMLDRIDHLIEMLVEINTYPKASVLLLAQLQEIRMLAEKLEHAARTLTGDIGDKP